MGQDPVTPQELPTLNPTTVEPRTETLRGGPTCPNSHTNTLHVRRCARLKRVMHRLRPACDPDNPP